MFHARAKKLWIILVLSWIWVNEAFPGRVLEFKSFFLWKDESSSKLDDVELLL